MNENTVNKNIWKTLPAPFYVLAPMEDVTDSVFRQIVCDLGRPDLFVTEFTSVEGLCSPGSSRVIKRFQHTDIERPLIAQIWGVNPENYLKVASMVVEMGFDGIDINMGCPIKKIIKNGGCSAMIKNPTLAREVYLATVEGAKGLPVSIKTRIGFSKVDTENWIGFVLGLKPAALTVHGRTADEQSKVPCHWDEIGKAVVLRNKISPETLIIGNGDVKSLEQGDMLAKEYGVDGLMIGRGIFDNPWVFNRLQDTQEHSMEERLLILKKHVVLHNETWGGRYNFEALKKFFKMYIKGFDGAAELRGEMMNLKSLDETVGFLNDRFQI
ncbi:tRNA-dihydrouridine synthase [Candidatus Dojkabacteria bacterium]|nr:tRNA-dihydrouridine synthase [Candidatus Dojkabacteria bacterium]